MRALCQKYDSFAAFFYKKHSGKRQVAIRLVLLVSTYLFGGLVAVGAVTAVSVQDPNLKQDGTLSLNSPVHFQATAESAANITGYVIYVDNQNVYQNFVPQLDTWVMVGPGTHTVYIKAWDSTGALASTPIYSVNITGFAPPSPPANATRVMQIAANPSEWIADNNGYVGGNCNDGSIAAFKNVSNPNTNNSPAFPDSGLHVTLTSKCQYDDALFYWKDTAYPTPYAADTNFLWDFWFYIPTTTHAANVQALEFDLFQAVQLSDGVHEFMFGSQCNYVTNQWQLWLPQNGNLTWVNTGISPCQFGAGAWHHATYFLQRVTPSGYQKIPATFTSTSDTNTSLRFGTVTIDGNTRYLGGVAYSTIPGWAPVLGVQHQLDSAVSGVTIEEYVAKESVTAW
jgi:hypothetical protein